MGDCYQGNIPICVYQSAFHKIRQIIFIAKIFILRDNAYCTYYVSYCALLKQSLFRYVRVKILLLLVVLLFMRYLQIYSAILSVTTVGFIVRLK